MPCHAALEPRSLVTSGTCRQVSLTVVSGIEPDLGIDGWMQWEAVQ